MKHDTCCMAAPLHYSNITILKKNGAVPTFWLCELSERGQGDEGVGN